MAVAPTPSPVPRPIRLAQLVSERLSLCPPVDVLAAICVAGLRLKEVEISTNLDGCLAYHRRLDRFGIFVNTRFRDPLRRRFTLAHEFGHYILHRQLVRNAGRTEVLESSDLEADASQFASELLMPASDVRLVRFIPEPERYFRVSRAAWETRIRQLP